MGVDFTCIYCRNSAPTVVASTAHVFPDVIGGAEFTKTTVCRECNGAVNRLAEMPALAGVLALQSLFGIRGRRNKIRAVRGIAKVGEQQAVVYLNERGELDQPIVFVNLGPDGKKRFSIFGPKDGVEAKMKEIAASDPGLKWEDMPKPERAMVEVDFANSETLAMLRGLAAKVAFERLAQLRGADFVLGSDYDDVRAFILTRNDPNNCTGTLSDARVRSALFRNFPPPHHAVYTVAHPAESVLGAFVVFYGLFYYWVILSRRYCALDAWDDLLLQNPQAREATNPLLRGRLGDVHVDWDAVVAPYTKDPQGANKEAGRYAVDTFRRWSEAFYGPPDKGDCTSSGGRDGSWSD